MATITGTQADDFLSGTEQNDRIYGFAGADIIYGLGNGDGGEGGNGLPGLLIEAEGQSGGFSGCGVGRRHSSRR